MGQFIIDDDGFVWYEDFRLPLRVDIERAVVEFFDKDRRRSEERGTRFVEITAQEFETMLHTLRTENGPGGSSSALLRG